MRLNIMRNGIAAALLCLLAGVAPAGEAESPAWHAWSPQAFEQTRCESHLALLDVVAEWCRLCKKMERTTYRDPKVLAIIRQRYVAVRADVDRQSEIQRRYGGYGVPAVVILDAAGNEIIRRRGYLEPEWLYWLLVAVADDPRPEAHR